MKHLSTPFAGFCGVVLFGISVAAVPIANDVVDRVFKPFWDARTSQDAARIVPDILKAGITFEDVLKRVKAGRSYSASVSKGVVKSSYRAHGREFFYALNIPESYDPARQYQVRFQLHGGVMRPSNQPRGDGSIGALAGAEQIYIIPYAWADAPWWNDVQIDNLETILDTVKRTYNVDENRVVMCGVSDGGTGAFYFAMRDTTPFASFLPLNGNMLVLRSEDTRLGDLFPNNLKNKPFFGVNGGRDPLYPAEYVGQYVDHLRKKGVDFVFRPQPNGVHNTAWWPEVKDTFESFVRDHPRKAVPDKLTWESDGGVTHNRAHWLIIDKLAPKTPAEPHLEDVNLLTDVGPPLFDNVHASGRVDIVRTGNTITSVTTGVAEFTLLLAPDVFDFSQPVIVRANGRTVFNGMVEPSTATLLKWAARDNDRTMVFGAELHIKI